MNLRLREQLQVPGYLFICFFGLWLQASLLFSKGWLPYFAPDILLILAIWGALKLRFLMGGITILVFARIAEIQSACPAGMFMCVYMAVYLAVKASLRYLSFAKFTHLMTLTLLFAFLARLVQTGVWGYLGMTDSVWWATLVRWIPRSVGATLHGFWLYPILFRFEKWVLGADAEQQLSEDDILIEERF